MVSSLIVEEMLQQRLGWSPVSSCLWEAGSAGNKQAGEFLGPPHADTWSKSRTL